MMTLDEMLSDYCRRCPQPMTVGRLQWLIRHNHIVIDDDCFLIYATALDQVRILCPYAPKGKTTVTIGRQLEAAAQKAGYKKFSIITDRPKAFGRLFRDLKPVGVIFEKNL